MYPHRICNNFGRSSTYLEIWISCDYQVMSDSGAVYREGRNHGHQKISWNRNPNSYFYPGMLGKQWEIKPQSESDSKITQRELIDNWSDYNISLGYFKWFGGGGLRGLGLGGLG